jgi:hypothetical protein
MPTSQSQEVLQKYLNPVFVETGTLRGDAVEFALKVGFKEIYSVEVHKAFYDKCVTRFKDQTNVHLFLGDSIDTLWNMIKDISVPITFWLDGHIYPRSGVSVGKKNIPIMEELEIIAQHPIKTHTIMIDDRRVMGTQCHGWQTISEKMVIDGVKRINPAYEIRYEDSCHARNDIVVGIIP